MANSKSTSDKLTEIILDSDLYKSLEKENKQLKKQLQEARQEVIAESLKPENLMKLAEKINPEIARAFKCYYPLHKVDERVIDRVMNLLSLVTVQAALKQEVKQEEEYDLGLD